MFGKVVGSDVKKNPYVSKDKSDIYPKRSRYEYNLRQYLTSIKNISRPINKIKATRILENSGYLVDVYLGKKIYREKGAMNVMMLFFGLTRDSYSLFLRPFALHTNRRPVRERWYKIFRDSDEQIVEDRIPRVG